METLLLLLASYVLTGIALTAYDFAAPPLHAKAYVTQRNHAQGLLNWFAWPLSTAFDVYQLAVLRRKPVRHLLGVAMLGVGILVVLRFVFLIAELFIPWHWLAYVLAFIVTLLASPILAAMTMPAHGQPRREGTA